jgi:hypothetical protein
VNASGHNRKERETSYERFVHRRRTFSVSREGFDTEYISVKFKDDKWSLLNIVKPSERKGDATINFSEIPAWLRFDAKCYMAHLWLETSTYSNEVQQVMTSLRILGRTLSSYSDRPIDLRKKQALQFQRMFKKRGYSLTYNKTVFRYVNSFMSFVRQQYPKEKGSDFVIDVPRRKGPGRGSKPRGQSKEKKISTEILTAILDACNEELNSYLTALSNWPYPDPTEFPKEYNRVTQRRYKQCKKLGLKMREPGDQIPKLRELNRRAIKAQVVKLMICVGRRASSVCNSPFEIRTEKVEWTNEAGVLEKTVLVRFRETKIRNIDEYVACPGVFGELAISAIKTAKKLTADLRRDNPRWADYLFLVPGREAKSAQVISVAQINQYLNGENGSKGRRKGLLQRYNISSTRITSHHFRLTRATNLWLGGMQVHEVSDDLGHRGTEMVIRHYIVGTEESMRRYQSFMDRQALSGAVMDFVGGQEVVHTRLSARHVEIMKNFGLIVVPTRYGYCARHACLGTCDRATPCYTGIDGIECDFHVLSPDALFALQEDKEVIEANIASYGNKPGFTSWVNNSRNQLVVIERKIGQASTLKDRYADNDGVQVR